jgi:hypothetical protein
MAVSGTRNRDRIRTCRRRPLVGRRGHSRRHTALGGRGCSHHRRRHTLSPISHHCIPAVACAAAVRAAGVGRPEAVPASPLLPLLAPSSLPPTTAKPLLDVILVLRVCEQYRGVGEICSPEPIFKLLGSSRIDSARL